MQPRPLRRLHATVAALLFVVLLGGACGDSSDEGAAAPLTPPRLDLETRAGHSEDFGSLGPAERSEGSFVGWIDEGKAIGVAPVVELVYPEAPDDPDVFLVQVYDRDRTAIAVSELEAGSSTTLETEVGDFDATVELELGGDVVSGTVRFPGEAATTFDAQAATGVGGVYSAFGAEDDPDVGANWVVLPDGRQWGMAFCTLDYLHTLMCGGNLLN